MVEDVFFFVSLYVLCLFMLSCITDLPNGTKVRKLLNDQLCKNPVWLYTLKLQKHFHSQMYSDICMLHLTKYPCKIENMSCESLTNGKTIKQVSQSSCITYQILDIVSVLKLVHYYYCKPLTKSIYTSTDNYN